MQAPDGSDANLSIVRMASIVSAGARERASGLLAYLRIEFEDGLVVDGITLRRTRAGKLALSYPERVDRHGVRHPIIRPVSDEVRVRIERAVFAAIGLEDQP